MTSIKILGSLGLLLGLALVSIATNPILGRLNKRRLVDLTVFDNKGEAFGKVVRDGDRFVALDLRKDPKLGFLRNFEMHGIDTLEVDDNYLGYDLRGKNKNVLVREGSGKDIRWELSLEIVHIQKERELVKRLRVKNGELKGWWIGLGPVEPAKKEEKTPRDKYPRAPLILVKDKKDAAGFRWPHNPPDDGR